MYWVVVANTNLYTIYHYDSERKTLSLSKRESHPENKEKISQLVSDRPGHYHSSSSARGAYSESDPKKEEIDRLFRKLADELLQGCLSHQFKRLIFFAVPQVNGVLLDHLDKQVVTLTNNEIKKDLTHLSENELAAYLHEHWRELK